MFVIAVFTEMPTPASCSETRVLTRNGYQIVTENEVYFVSKERFLKKYKDNLFITTGTKDRLLTFEEAQELRAQGHAVLVSKMNKNKKFQKDQLTAEGYTEIVEYFNN